MIKVKEQIFILFLLLLAEVVAGPIPPIPEYIEFNKSKALLGRELFLDNGLSQDKTISCSSCHNLYSGADFRAKSIGIKGRVGDMNSPTVFNAVFNFKQMWNGRAKDLKEQVLLPLHNPKEMGMSNKDILNYLNSSKKYKNLFKKVYNKEPDIESFVDAIAEFEKALITPNSPFDKYLKREHNLSPKELRGYFLFKKIGCVTCHNGVNIGGNSYQKFGLIREFNRKSNTQDLYTLTRRDEDKNVFKVPTLRNIALTAPYFHNGQTKSLKEAIKVMAKYNLGFELSEDELDALEAFLKTLTGERPAILTKEFK
jgi:cytochrome c peroxidase